ncbi:hypothetical protein SAMN05216404_106157 [Nitrosospira multiformis]|uniref:Uncharacterized protein n=1 Tax=Nitrosospira multiformis TaxID=1231 RepID=A0A1H8IRQ1_9PROT|nr:hypothetical protein [Nitrosospira multiformis]SEN71072.1 hypothetical protein SAMN05216404_106157 [Nitrosospira multiformis]
MTTFTQSQGAKSGALVTMGALASDTYIASAAIDLGANIPLDSTFEVVATVTSPVSDKQVILFAQLSLDGTDFTTGPTSGSSATDEADLHWIGTLPCNSTGTHRKLFSLSGLPVAQHIKLVVRNRTGVTLTSGFVYRADITGASA